MAFFPSTVSVSKAADSVTSSLMSGRAFFSTALSGNSTCSRADCPGAWINDVIVTGVDFGNFVGSADVIYLSLQLVTEELDFYGYM